MNAITYYFTILKSKLFGGGNKVIVQKLRKEGMIIGNNTHILSNLAPGEPYLVEIGDNCTISSHVNFITHDASIGCFMGRENFSDICGKIKIGNNCFIGNGATILYGVTLKNKVIVAAGSVVTHSFDESGVILGGNPAKIIGRVSDFLDKTKSKMMSLHGKSYEDRKNIILDSDKYIER